MKLTKKNIATVVSVLVVLSLLGFSIFYVVASNNNTVTLNPGDVVPVDRGDLSAVFITSATVQSGQQGIFEILDGTLVEEVFVRVGDQVEAGQLLATFDPTHLNTMLGQRRSDYHNARRSYQQYTASMANAPAQASQLREQIAELEARIATNIENGGNGSGGNQQLNDLRRVLTGIMGNGRIANWMVDQVLHETGNIAQTITAFQSLISSIPLVGSLVGFGNFDGMGGLMNSDAIQLMQLRMQETMLGIQSGIGLDNVYRALMESAQSAYRHAEVTITQLRDGWHATYDGVMREVNITPGEVYFSEDSTGPADSLNMTAMLAQLAMGNADIGAMLGGLFGNTVSGMVIEYYPFAASFTLGQRDIGRVVRGLPVRVTSIVSGENFEGEVYFVSPVAGSGSGGGGLDDMLGGLTGGARGVEARISIAQPDLSITIGLDVEVTIELDTREGVLRVPATAIARCDESEEERHFVFGFDRANRTVERIYVEIGLLDNYDAWYEIMGGIDEGTEILRTQPRGMQAGDRVRLV